MNPEHRTARLPLTFQRTARIVAGLLLLLAAASVVAVAVGSVQIPLPHVLDTIAGGTMASPAEQTIILSIRLPRILLAMIVGAGLSVAGVVFQALLRNPLAEPYILGISSGGTVGALVAFGIAAGTAITAPVAAFLGCALVMALVYALGHRNGQLDTYALLLAGVMVGAFFNAMILIAFAVSDKEMKSAFLWLMGNLSGARADSLLVAGPVLLVVSSMLMIRAKAYNLVATGEESALLLGVDVNRFRRWSYLAASLVTGVAVSLSGVIGFVGLVVPHVCRMLFGPDHRVLLPASFLVGATFLVIADTISRVLIAPVEIPVGAVTAALGAPAFIYLLKRS
jgi:iron complex transport system permease protein